MDHCTIYIGSMTLALRGRDILLANSLPAEVIRIHRKSGCGYGLRMDCSLLESARKFLRTAGIGHDLL